MTLRQARDDAPRQDRGAVGVLLVVLVFAALFGLAEFTAVSNLVALPALYEQLGMAGEVPWALLVAGAAAPPLFLLIALWTGRGRSLPHRAVILAAALGAVHALALSASAIVAAGFRIPVG